MLIEASALTHGKNLSKNSNCQELIPKFLFFCISGKDTIMQHEGLNLLLVSC